MNCSCLQASVLSALVLTVLVSIGCSASDGVTKADVSGVVTLDGQPLANAEVFFVNEENGFEGFAETNSEGKYQLVQGAAVGANKVFFSKLNAPEGFDEDPESGMDAGQLEAAGSFDLADGPGEDIGEQIPSSFTAEKSKLTYDVPSGGSTDADFKLVSE